MTRIKTSKWPTALFAGLAVVLLSSTASAMDVKIWTVDCSDPEQTIANALSHAKADRVDEIHFTGLCYEELDFNTGNVTITGDAVSSTIEGHVSISGASNVILDGFNLEVGDDSDTGVEASMGASIRITDVTINGEGADTVGILVLNGSVARIENTLVTMAGSDSEALQARDGGMVRLRGGNNLNGGPDKGGGVAVTDHATLIQGGGHDIINGELEITGMSYVRTRNVSIVGDVGISRHSGLRLRDDLAGGLTVEGNVSISRDSYAYLEGRSGGRSVNITGFVVCDSEDSHLELRGNLNPAVPNPSEREVYIGGSIGCTNFLFDPYPTL